MKLTLSLCAYACLARAAYFPATQSDQIAHQTAALTNEALADTSADSVTGRIAWLEYLAHVYIEVYNYKRAQKCVDELRRLSGISLSDASTTRLAINGIAKRMRGAGKGPARKSGKFLKKEKNLFESAVNKIMAKRSRPNPQPSSASAVPTAPQDRAKEDMMKAERNTNQYWQQVMSGGQQPGQFSTSGYFSQGSTQTPGPSYPHNTEQAEAIRRRMECPDCPQYSAGQMRRGYPNTIRHHQNIPRTAPPDSTTPFNPHQAISSPKIRQNRVYSTDNKSFEPTDDIHQLLFDGRVEEANRLFSLLIQTSSSPNRPVYRLELLLSLIDLDLTEENDCVPLWDASWRLPWQDKLRIVDLYRSVRSAPSDSLHYLFQSISDMRYHRELIARIKTIMVTEDALEAFSRVPSKLDFYLCGQCWARKQMGIERMQRVLVRAEHDAELAPPFRALFRQRLKESFTERFDPRTYLFSTVYPREFAFSMITGEYSGLYKYQRANGGYFAQHSQSRNTHGYRPLKNPDPLGRDRQQVLLDVFADGSPEILANMMYEGKHRLVKEMLNESPHANMVATQKQVDEYVKSVDQGKGGRSKKKWWQFWKKKNKTRPGDEPSGDEEPSEQDTEMNDKMNEAYDQLKQDRNELLKRLSNLLAKTIKAESPAEGIDDFGMSIQDFGTFPLSSKEHKSFISKLNETRTRIQALRKYASQQGSTDQERRYDEQLEYLEKVAAAQDAMNLVRERLDNTEDNLPRHIK